MGIFMMVLNAEDTLERALSPFAGHVDELSIVDTGSTDSTIKTIVHLAEHVLKVPLRLTTIHPALDTHLYIPDTSETWFHHLPDPFTRQPILKDWSYVQNIAIKGLSTKYGLRIDADDVVDYAPGWKAACELMEAHPSVDMISSPYEVYSHDQQLQTITAMPRLFRLSKVRYQWPMHEQPRPRTDENHFFCAAGLRVKDMNDSKGKVRIAHRNAKILYHEYLNKTGLDSPAMEPEFEFTVGHEMVACEPELALTILELCSLDTADKNFHLARAYEALSHSDLAFSMKIDNLSALTLGEWEAKTLYEKALEQEPTKVDAMSKLASIYSKYDAPKARAMYERAVATCDRAKNINVWLPYLSQAASAIGKG